MPVKAIKWLLMNHSPLIIKPMMEASMWRWGFAMLRNCTEARYKVNKARMVRVAEYSRDCLKELRAETGIAYDDRAQGTLQLFRTHKQLDGVHKDTEILDQYGVPYQVLDTAGYLKYEPALAGVKDKFVGALRLPGDETGDCFLFTQRLAKMAEALGAKFRFGVEITGIASDGKRVTGVDTNAGRLGADHVVLALGSFSPKWLAPLGIDIPVYPVKGFSITVPIKDAGAAPESTIMDETHKVAVTRLGDRIRVGGMAQLSGYDLPLDDARRKTLEFVLTDLFPDAGDLAQDHVLDRPAPDDARRHAGDGRHEAREPDAGHRPRHAGLDDGHRHGPRDRRPAERQEAGDRLRRPHGGALRRLKLAPKLSRGAYRPRGAPAEARETSCNRDLFDIARSRDDAAEVIRSATRRPTMKSR